MEPIPLSTLTASAAGVPPASRWRVLRSGCASTGWGLGVAVAVAVVASALGRLVPIVGGPVFGIILGGALATVVPASPRLAPGIAFASKRVLQASIVVLGTGLSLPQVLHAGRSSLLVMLGTLATALGGAWVFGRVLKVGPDTCALIGVGTGICGASAIAAVSAVIGAAEIDVAYAMGTIFAFNVVAVLLYPAIGHLLGLSQHAFGLWAGTAINDTSSVVAASYSYGAVAGSYAVVVKLTRSLMIIPVCVGVAYLRARRTDGPEGKAVLPWRRMFPLFILGFLAASGLQSAGLIPAEWHGPLRTTAVFLITVALAGVGMSTRVRTLKTVGPRPLLLGAILWVAVGASSLLLQLATGTL